MFQAGVAASARGGRGRRLVVPDSDHAIHHDRPELVAAVVLEVVEEVRQAEGRAGRDGQYNP